MYRSRTIGGGIAAALLATALLAGCGSDDDEATTTTAAAGDDTTATTAAGGGDVDADLAGYCDASFELDQAFGALDEPSQDDLEAIRPQVEDVIAQAPDELADAYATLKAAFDDAVDTGSFDAFDGDEFTAADDTVHGFEVDNCGFQEFAATATDYAYDVELPSAPGRYSLDLDNQGEEAHLGLVARLKDGEDGTAEEVFESVGSDEDAEAAFNEHFDQLGGPFVTPGDSDYQYLDLEPGQYILFCPIPVGSTPDNGFEGDGPPHFTQGMVQFFEISE